MTTGDAWFIGYVSGQATAVGIGLVVWLWLSGRAGDWRRRREFARFMRETDPGGNSSDSDQGGAPPESRG